jgi:hypothetical protein
MSEDRSSRVATIEIEDSIVATRLDNNVMSNPGLKKAGLSSKVANATKNTGYI